MVGSGIGRLIVRRKLVDGIQMMSPDAKIFHELWQSAELRTHFYVDKLHATRHPRAMAKSKDGDHYTKAGAKALAERIEKFWRARGYRGVAVTPYRLDGFDLYGIRSNLVGGLPAVRWLR